MLPLFVAQYLQIIKRERSGWIMWGITNLAAVWMWVGVGQPQVAIMYIAFTVNSIRGYVNWTDLAKV